MNVPPSDGIRVDVEELRQLVTQTFSAVPIPEEHARLIADLLIDTELRGVVSHGVVQVDRYVRSYQEGNTNTHPQIRTLHEGPVTAALTGDGGLGMIVATQAMQTVITKAREMGVAAATTTYHAHLGSSGKYVRMALREDMIGISFSGRNAAPSYSPDSTIKGSIQGSPPLAFGMPSGPEHPYFCLDYASHVGADEEAFREMPAVLFKAIGMSHVANIMSGTLGGQMLPEFERDNIQYTDANQSGFFLALDIERFAPLQAFKDDMDRLMGGVSNMEPLLDYPESTLPGGRAWQKEKDYRTNGIPISSEAVAFLEALAGEFGLSVPW